MCVAELKSDKENFEDQAWIGQPTKHRRDAVVAVEQQLRSNRRV